MKTKWTISKEHRAAVGRGAYCSCPVCEEVHLALLHPELVNEDSRVRVIMHFNRGRISKRDLRRYGEA